MYSYKVKKRDKDFKQAVIEKSGLTQEMSIADAEYTLEQNKKTLNEIEGQLKIQAATMKNVEDNFTACVRKLSPLELHQISVFATAREKAAMAMEKSNEFRTAIKQQEKDIETLYKFMGEKWEGKKLEDYDGKVSPEYLKIKFEERAAAVEASKELPKKNYV